MFPKNQLNPKQLTHKVLQLNALKRLREQFISYLIIQGYQFMEEVDGHDTNIGKWVEETG